MKWPWEQPQNNNSNSTPALGDQLRRAARKAEEEGAFAEKERRSQEALNIARQMLQEATDNLPAFLESALERLQQGWRLDYSGTSYERQTRFGHYNSVSEDAIKALPEYVALRNLCRTMNVWFKVMTASDFLRIDLSSQEGFLKENPIPFNDKLREPGNDAAPLGDRIRRAEKSMAFAEFEREMDAFTAAVPAIVDQILQRARSGQILEDTSLGGERQKNLLSGYGWRVLEGADEQSLRNTEAVRRLDALCRDLNIAFSVEKRSCNNGIGLEIHPDKPYAGTTEKEGTPGTQIRASIKANTEKARQEGLQTLRQVFNELTNRMPLIVEAMLKAAQSGNTSSWQSYDLKKAVTFEGWHKVTDETLHNMPEYKAFYEQCKKLNIGYSIERVHYHQSIEIEVKPKERYWPTRLSVLDGGSRPFF